MKYRMRYPVIAIKYRILYHYNTLESIAYCQNNELLK